MSTERSRPIEGYRQPQESDKDKPIDPKKFEEELTKVRESDPSEKRKKRNLKKSEEEGEDEELDANKPLPTPGQAFTHLMTDETEEDSALSIQDPTNAKNISGPKSSGKIITFENDDDESKTPIGKSAPQAQPPQTSEEPTYKGPLEPLPPPEATQTTEAETTTPPVSENELPSQPPVSAKQEAHTAQANDSLQDNIDTQKPTQTSQTKPSQDQKDEQHKNEQKQKAKAKEKAKKKKMQDSSFIKEQKPSFDEYLRKKKEKGVKDLTFDETKKPKEEKVKQKPPEEIQKAKKDVEKENAAPLPKRALPSEKTTAKHLEHVERKEAKKKKDLKEKASKEKVVTTAEEKPIQTQAPKEEEKDKFKVSESAKAAEAKEPALKEAQEADSSSQDHKHDSKDKEKKAEEFADTMQATPIEGPQAPAPVPEAQAYSNIHPQVYELFEKMVGVMIIEQHKGVTTTTITVNMKGSVFDGSQIVLEHFSTAPNAFNVQLAGTPQAQELFNANVDELAAAFASSKYAFDVNIKKPILLKEHRAFSRKEKTSRDEKGGKQK